MLRSVKEALPVLEQRCFDVRSYTDAIPFLDSDDQQAAQRIRPGTVTIYGGSISP